MRVARPIRTVCVLLAWASSATARAEPPTGGAVTTSEVVPVSPPVLREPTWLDYPPEAGAEHGDVTVRVTVDEQGRVVEAELIEGPVVFEAAAELAAKRLVFDPATRAGAPVRAAVRVFFHFAPPQVGGGDEPMDAEAVEEVVIHADRPQDADTHARTTLDDAALQRAAGQDLAETVASVSGVTMARGSADTGKPVIRGQTERRLLLLVDGVRHESQKWGADHAPEIDPFAAGEVSVIKGAAGVRYGPDAIGGVVLVSPPPMRTAPGVSGRALATFSSNGARPSAAFRLDGAPAKVEGLSLRAEGSFARGAALHAPDYVLGNTGSQLWTAGASVQYQRGLTQIRATWQHYDLRAGVFYGVRYATPDELRGQLDAGRPASADAWTRSYDIDRPYQAVSHDRITLHARTRAGSFGTVRAVYAFQLNHRTEFEQVREDVTGPQYDFTLRTHSLDVGLDHDRVRVGATAFEGGATAAASFQENVYRGLSLLPNHRGYTVGVAAFERASWQRGDLELGARYDRLGRTAFLQEGDYERHARRGTLDDVACAVTGGVARCPNAYDTGSVSLGGLWHAVPDALDLKLDLSSASRFPSVDELYLMGSAPSFPVFAVGSPGLGVETTWGASPTVGLRLSWLEAELSAYVNYVSDYIYFAPELTSEGTPAFDVTVRGAFPRFSYTPVDALFYGADGSVSLGPTWPLGLDVSGALVRGQDTAGWAHLVGVPADRLRFSLVGRPPGTATFRAPYVTAIVDVVGRQSRVADAVDLAPAPSGYVLLGLSVGTEIPLRDVTLRLGVDATNLLDAAYREYTSLLRYYADEPGRDVRVRVGVDF